MLSHILLHKKEMNNMQQTKAEHHKILFTQELRVCRVRARRCQFLNAISIIMAVVLVIAACAVCVNPGPFCVYCMMQDMCRSFCPFFSLPGAVD